jgi:Tol biopolymer transport system component
LAKRTITTLLGATIALLAAAPAQATLVYTKNAKDGLPRVFVADNDGKHPHRIGTGFSPTVSSDGRWVAWIAGDQPQTVKLRLADRSRKARDVMDASEVSTVRFSPDSKLLGIEAGTRLWVYDIHDRESVRAASGNIRGFSFSPDSTAVAFGTAGHNPSFEAPSDLYSFAIADKKRTRITRDRKSLNPLWTSRGIIHDRQRIRDNAAPSYNLFEIDPDGGNLRRITSLKNPALASGLVPLELSANGKRLIAEYEGQDLSVGFRVNPDSGSAHALGKFSESAFVAKNLTADGKTVLGITGGADPSRRHNVVTMPYRGGNKTILVRDAFDADWSR